ncbi:hypothetical protein MTR_4g088570 [Medicago truncatula]|uniref:Uncharacterized protein n=1 Tax=Medicago truncatula TaxID=3880 RepID=A0A072UMV9_MEDTR|nr:hypothetical protein MTR_4g088570 [Medicago truncatula]
MVRKIDDDDDDGGGGWMKKLKKKKSEVKMMSVEEKQVDPNVDNHPKDTYGRICYHRFIVFLAYSNPIP